jgi:hypothetical protein
MGIDQDHRFDQFRLWESLYPFDNSTAPIFTATYMDKFKAEIAAGTLSIHSIDPTGKYKMWREPDIWQFTARCNPAYLACYNSMSAKLAVDYNVVYMSLDGTPYNPPIVYDPVTVDYVVARLHINVREGSNINSKWLGYAKEGDLLHIDKSENSYSHAVGIGWVYSDYIKRK